MYSSPGKHYISLQDPEAFFKEVDEKAQEELEMLNGTNEVGVQVSSFGRLGNGRLVSRHDDL